MSPKPTAATGTAPPMRSRARAKTAPDTGRAAAWWPRPVPRRRRVACPPFLLCIADHDTGRFTLEGPMTDAEAWIREVIAARRAGRNITCRVLPATADEAAMSCARAEGATRWPSRSIVSPETALRSSRQTG